MKEHTFESSIDASPSVGAPQFDDERTLLTARQVVPLEKIDAKVRHRRQWVLGGAFAVAMMLGAASALVASYLRMRQVNGPVNAISEVELTPEPVTLEQAPTIEPVTVASIGEPEPALEPDQDPRIELVTPKKETTTKRKSVPRSEPDFGPSHDLRMSEEDELERIRNAVLYEEWQERRLRRAVRRERRRAERDNRDLSNLDEIFEGRRRRLNP